MSPLWLPLLSLLLLLLLWARSEADVVNFASDCSEFFLNRNPPHIPGVLENELQRDWHRFRCVCHTYGNRRRFFTLYDTASKIPVFSAYVFKGNAPGVRRPRIFWMTEPELEDHPEPCYKRGVCENQAVPNDYKNTFGYDKGHLYPSSFGFSYADKSSTFTLTNAVPQAHTFNSGSWNRMENCTKCVMKKYCVDNNARIKGYLVTGAEPGNNLLNSKVNIPSAMWSAFCCYSVIERKWIASAHWGRNVADSEEDQHMETETLNQLYSRFRAGFTLFPESMCPTDSTVAEFYPGLNAENEFCSCPSTPATTTKAPTTTRNPTTTTTTTTTKKPKVDDHQVHHRLDDDVREGEDVKAAVKTKVAVETGVDIREVVRQKLDIARNPIRALPKPRPNPDVIPMETYDENRPPLDVSGGEVSSDSASLENSPLLRILGRASKTSSVDLAPADLAPADLAPADLAPVEIAPVEIAPVEIAPVEIAPAEFVPVQMVPAVVAPHASVVAAAMPYLAFLFL